VASDNHLTLVETKLDDTAHFCTAVEIVAVVNTEVNRSILSLNTDCHLILELLMSE